MDRSGITLERMRSFVRVVERGSLSAVAREHGVGQSTVTRHVADLERALGVTLLNRTTRRLTLTDEGRRYHAEARTILRLVDEATDGVREAGRELTGRVRISCTSALGVRYVCGLLFAIQDRHPGLVVDLSLSDARIDLVGEAVDVAIRLGPLADSTMQVRALGRSRRLLVASRDYLAARGRPERPDELTPPAAIPLSNVPGSHVLALRGPDGLKVPVPVGGGLLVDHGLAAREALARGRGFAATHVWLVDDLLQDGTVEPILPDFALEPVPLSLLVVPGRTRIRRVRMLVDALAGAMATVPGIERG